MKRVEETATSIEKPLERLAEEQGFSKDLVEKAINNLKSKNFTGIALNTDVDRLKISKQGTTYIVESHQNALKLVGVDGEKDVGFSKIGKYEVIGRHPETDNLYMAQITHDTVGVQDLGIRAPPYVSRIDLIIAGGSEFFNVGSNEAVIEAEDKF